MPRPQNFPKDLPNIEVSDSWNISVQIVRFVDEYQPGIVACEFLDAAGHCHTIIAKVPLVSMKDLCIHQDRLAGFDKESVWNHFTWAELRPVLQR